MKKKNVGKGRKTQAIVMAQIEANAAGIDVGATEMYVAVPPDRDEDNVRCFPNFTADLNRLADWLKRCRIETVAMESTGVYWIPLFQILEERGFRVCLVNARHVKNVPGRKTDVLDCQWLQYLHSVGLLKASYRPAQQICAMRSIWRHRDNQVRMAARHVQHMQKALDQMNLQLHHVISDLTGKTGMAIVDAILKGERDPGKLADLRHGQIKASRETIMQSLIGDYRSEHLFVLRQALEAYRQYQQRIEGCDREIEQRLRAMEGKGDNNTAPSTKQSKKRQKPKGNEPRFELTGHLTRVFGVDLTQVPGISSLTAQVFLSEVGPDLSRFPNAGAFASWLGLCPNNRISGGRLLSSHIPNVTNRLNIALRMAAQSLHGSRSYLGDFYRRTKSRTSGTEAIVTMAHKLARILYRLVTTRQSYDESVFIELEQRNTQRRINSIKKQAAALGLQIVEPQPCVP